MKTLSERERELKDEAEKPFRRAEALANDVTAHCKTKPIYGEAKVDFDTVVIACGGNNLRIKPAAGDGWFIEGAMPEGYEHAIGKEISHVEMLDVLLAFLAPQNAP